jgi:GTP-binding protein EngB required for normal cell division/uncharacterized protein (DUF697 family)
MTNDNEQIRQEMAQIQAELQSALQELVHEVGGKLKPKEREEIEKEFSELNEVLERLKTGLIWVALFGKTSVGKSAIANSLVGEDIAEVGIQNDLTTIPTPYEKPPWMIVDVPGVMGEEVNEKVAIEEARKAHGHVFVIEGEPLGPELKLFDLVHNQLPNTPKIVFVNKWDKTEAATTSQEQQIMISRIKEKMGKFVNSSEDIIYGSSLIKERDTMVRQKLPQLLDRMYEDAGTLGQVMNILDPAGQADNLSGKLRDKIILVRETMARKVIGIFAISSIAGTIIPFSQVIAAPTILISMVFVLSKVMGSPIPKEKAREIAENLMRASWDVIAADLALDIAGALATMFTPFGIFAFFAGMAGSAYLSYRRTCILGEITLEYIKLGFSWGGERPQEVIKKCKERASANYARLKQV